MAGGTIPALTRWTRGIFAVLLGLDSERIDNVNMTWENGGYLLELPIGSLTAAARQQSGRSNIETCTRTDGSLPSWSGARTMSEPVNSCCERFKCSIKHFWWSYFCSGPPDGNGTHALQPLIALFVFFVAQLAAEIFAEQNKGVRKLQIVLYLVMGFLTISLIFLIGRAKRHDAVADPKPSTADPKPNGERWVFGYDFGTRLGHAMVAVCVLSHPISVCGLQLYCLLPGQKPLPLRPMATQVADKVTMELAGLKKRSFF